MLISEQIAIIMKISEKILSSKNETKLEVNNFSEVGTGLQFKLWLLIISLLKACSLLRVPISDTNSMPK